MITFYNRSIAASFMSFAACCVLSLLASGLHIIYLLPYIIFFGAYPIANYIEGRYKVNEVLVITITCVWFDAPLYVFYIFTKLFITDIAFINEYIIPIIAIGLNDCVFWISDNDEKAATENRFAIWQTVYVNALIRPERRIR